MAIDAYSLCPGGTGKKIKFCCGDFLPELQKIDRMLEGEQYTACLQHVDRLMEQESNRDRACLLATKCLVLWVTQQRQAGRAAAARFLTKHPNNQTALAEMAIWAADDNPRAALELVQRALRAGGGKITSRVYQALGLVAAGLLRAGFPLAVQALFQLQTDVAEQDDHAAEVLARLCRATSIPLLLRDDPPLASCPDDAPWKDRFTKAIENAASCDWLAAADQLASLAGDVPDAPVIWRNLATLRGWLADNPGCIEALRRYAALRAREPDGLEDAVEAEAVAMLLGSDPLGDRLVMFKVVWTVKDADRAQEGFLSSPQWQAVSFDPARFGDAENPPPRAAYLLLDRPMPASAEGLAAADVPSVVGQALLYGRQTDREARLEVLDVAADEVPMVLQMVAQAAGEAVERTPAQETTGHWSACRKLLQPSWQPPRDIAPEQLRTLMADHTRNAILRRWPALKLGVLDGRTPRDAAGDPARRTRLLAAILVLDEWAGRLPGAPDLNQLRAELGLPTLDAIELAGRPVDEVPAVRLERLRLEGLSDDNLLQAYYRASAFAVTPAARKFAAAIAERPSLADASDRFHALVTLARTEENVSKALAHIERGRRAADEKKMSNASWDLIELSIRFAEHNAPESMRLIEHIQRRHLEEHGVGETLTRMLIDVGLLQPDGTPVYSPEEAEQAAVEAEAAAEPGGLWTPDSAPAAGGGKLWTPDS
jgi:hypothetical protein